MPWNWLFFGQFQYVGYFSHSVLVTELDFELRISKFQFFWKFLEFLEIVWKYTIFDHFCKVEHIFHSILVTEFDFPLKSCRFYNFRGFQDFLGISRFPISRFQKMLQNEHFLLIFLKTSCRVNPRPNFCILGDFHNFQISTFQIPENLEILWKLLFLTNFNILGIFPTQFWSLSLILSPEFQNSNFP